MNAPTETEDPILEAHNKLVRSQVEFCITALEREKDYHERRLKTLTLAITSMRRELDLMRRDWTKLPADIMEAFNDANGKN